MFFFDAELLYTTVLYNSDTHKKAKKNSIYLAGSFSGLVNSFFSCPMELVKIRLQNQSPNGNLLYKGPIDCIAKIVKSQGFKGLYRGFGMTLVRETPSYGGTFCAFNLLH